MPRGRPKGQPKSGGRKAGRPNKVTSDVKEYARQFCQEAIDGLVSLARSEASPPAARVAAWDKVLDRGLGKAPQALTGPNGGSIIVEIKNF